MSPTAKWMWPPCTPFVRELAHAPIDGCRRGDHARRPRPAVSRRCSRNLRHDDRRDVSQLHASSSGGVAESLRLIQAHGADLLVDVMHARKELSDRRTGSPRPPPEPAAQNAGPRRIPARRRVLHRLVTRPPSASVAPASASRGLVDGSWNFRERLPLASRGSVCRHTGRDGRCLASPETRPTSLLVNRRPRPL